MPPSPLQRSVEGGRLDPFGWEEGCGLRGLGPKARLAEVEKKYLYALAEIETVRRRGRQQTEDAQPRAMPSEPKPLRKFQFFSNQAECGVIGIFGLPEVFNHLKSIL